MTNAIRESKIIAATLILEKFFDKYIWHAYEALEECESKNNYFELRSISAFTKFYFGQTVRAESEAALQDSIWSVFEAYIILLTIDKSHEQANAIKSLIDEARNNELEILTKFYHEDIAKKKAK